MKLLTGTLLDIVFNKKAMITEEQLKSINFYPNKKQKHLFYDPNNEYEYNIKTQELYCVNDGVTTPSEFVCKINNFDKLKELLELPGF